MNNRDFSSYESLLFVPFQRLSLIFFLFANFLVSNPLSEHKINNHPQVSPTNPKINKAFSTPGSVLVEDKKLQKKSLQSFQKLLSFSFYLPDQLPLFCFCFSTTKNKQNSRKKKKKKRRQINNLN